MLAAAEKFASILFGAGLTLAVAWMLGRVLFRRLRGAAGELTNLELHIFSLSCGAAALSSAVLLLAAARLVYDPTFLAVAAVAFALWWRHGRHLLAYPEFPLPAGRQPWSALLVIVLGFYAYLYVPHALAPEIQADGVGYHLGLVSNYYRNHGFSGLTTSFYAHLSQGAEMLYLFAFAFGRHSAAKLVHFAMFAATIAAILAFALRHGVWRAGVAGAILYTCAPLIGPDATSTYNDCALAFYQFLTVYVLLIWWKNRAPQWLPVIGILAGFCFSIKYTGFLAVILALAVVALGTWRDGASRCLRTILVTGAVATAFVVPWLAKNAVVTGNPVAPLYNHYFPNPYLTESWERGYRGWLEHYAEPGREVSLVGDALELTVRGVRLQGLLGPVFLLAPLALLAWRQPLSKPLLAAAALFAVPWFSNAGARFLIPSLLFVSLAMGLSLYCIPEKWAAALAMPILLLHAASSWPWLLPKWHEGGVWQLYGVPWKYALRLAPEYEYLSAHVPHFLTSQILSKNARPGDRVFSFEPIPEAYAPVEIMVAFQGALNEQLQRVIAATADLDLMPIRRQRLAWKSQPLRGLRIVQTQSHESSEWVLSEVRLFHQATERIPQPTWRIRAPAYPWTAARAFDGNPATAWFSWQILHPGLKIEVEFPGAIDLDAAGLIYPWGQHYVGFEYFGLSDAGWLPLEVSAQPDLRPIPATILRTQAHRELAANRVKFLVTNTAGPFAQIGRTIESNPLAWGLDEIGQDGPLRIYRVLDNPPSP